MQNFSSIRAGLEEIWSKEVHSKTFFSKIYRTCQKKQISRPAVFGIQAWVLIIFILYFSRRKTNFFARLIFREFLGNIRKTAPIIKTNRVNGPDFLTSKPDDLQSLTDPPRGGSCDFRRRTSAWSVAMLIHCFIYYTFKTQEMQSQVLKSARFIVLNLTKMTPFRHCRSSGFEVGK